MTARRETVLFLVGVSAITVGLWMAWPPAAPIVAGTICCAIAWLSAGLHRP